MNARFLLDTNTLVYIAEGGKPKLRQIVSMMRPGEIVTSSIVWAEFARGDGLSGPLAPRMLALFEKRFPVEAFDAAAALRFARLPFKRDRFDRLIAAHALALDLTLITNNEADFTDIPDLRVENWTRA